jgi:hypothetical protein
MKTKTKTDEAATADTSKESKATKPKPAVELDKFGCRAESQAAKINKALSTKPASVEDITKQCGLNGGRVRAHLKYLLGKKLVVQREDGWVLAK